jgi:hypothetical protein
MTQGSRILADYQVDSSTTCEKARTPLRKSKPKALLAKKKNGQKKKTFECVKSASNILDPVIIDRFRTPLDHHITMTVHPGARAPLFGRIPVDGGAWPTSIIQDGLTAW